MESKDRFTGINRIIHKLNPVIVAILRSPLHSMMSKAIMLISFTGRKSGKRYTTPVSYFQEDKTAVYVFTHGTWWKNLQGDVPVSLRLRGRDWNGFALPISEDKQRIADGLAMYLIQHPGNKGIYEVALDENGKPKAEDLLRAAQTATMIQIRISEV